MVTDELFPNGTRFEAPTMKDRRRWIWQIHSIIRSCYFTREKKRVPTFRSFSRNLIPLTELVRFPRDAYGLSSLPCCPRNSRGFLVIRCHRPHESFTILARCKIKRLNRSKNQKTDKNFWNILRIATCWKKLIMFTDFFYESKYRRRTS